MVTIFYKYIRGLLYGSEMYMEKAQVSMEYILITAFSLLVAIPLIVLFFQYSQTYNNEVTLNQANKVMDEILNAAETVYYLGEPSQKTITVYFPKDVQQVILEQGYFSFTINNGGNTYTLYRAAQINFTGNISSNAGAKNLKVRAVNNTITITGVSG